MTSWRNDATRRLRTDELQTQLGFHYVTTLTTGNWTTRRMIGKLGRVTTS